MSGIDLKPLIARIKAIEDRRNFDAWMREHTEDIKPECYPVFIDHLPSYIRSSNIYFIIEGELLMPEAREVVKTYVLPDRH